MDYSHPPHHPPLHCHGLLREQFTSSGYGAKFHHQTRFTGDGFLQPGSKMNPQLQNSRFLVESARLGKWMGNEFKSISFCPKRAVCYADEEITQKPTGASAPHQNTDYYNSRQQITSLVHWGIILKVQFVTVEGTSRNTRGKVPI